MGHSRYCESLEILCISVDMLHYFSYQLSTSYFHHCYLFHPPSPLWMDMPKRHTLAGQNIVSLEIVRVSQYSFSTRLTTSSIHPRHGGGDARKAHLEQSQYCEILEILYLSVDTLHYFSYQLSTSYFHHCYLFHPPSPLQMDMIRSIISLTSYQPVIFMTASSSIHHRHCGWICQKGTCWLVKTLWWRCQKGTPGAVTIL